MVIMVVENNVLYVIIYDFFVIVDCNFIKCYFLKSVFNYMIVEVFCFY